jgi:hypothetical protein
VVDLLPWMLDWCLECSEILFGVWFGSLGGGVYIETEGCCVGSTY